MLDGEAGPGPDTTCVNELVGTVASGDSVSGSSKMAHNSAMAEKVSDIWSADSTPTGAG
jgi:hypothetical protein